MIEQGTSQHTKAFTKFLLGAKHYGVKTRYSPWLQVVMFCLCDISCSDYFYLLPFPWPLSRH